MPDSLMAVTVPPGVLDLTRHARGPIPLNHSQTYLSELLFNRLPTGSTTELRNYCPPQMRLIQQPRQQPDKRTKPQPRAPTLTQQTLVMRVSPNAGN